MNKELINNEFLFYASEDGSIKIQVISKDDTIWLSQKLIAELFDVDRTVITKHLGNIFKEKELEEAVVCAIFAHTTQHGAIKGKIQQQNIIYYNLDVIIAVGYRVNSYKATKFRQWATKILKEYLSKGFVMDDERLKQGKVLFGKDYFDELLERIREIRTSERRFYQKITDIFITCSYDYDRKSPVTKYFFAMAQNKLEYAITGMTSAEIINKRANCKLPNMGMSTWKGYKQGKKIMKSDISIAKNYLTESEISELNRLVASFLDYAEVQAIRGKKMSMQDWHDRLDGFLKFNEYQVLQDYGSISKKIAMKNAEIQYKRYKPIQEQNYKSDFDIVVEQIRQTGKLPKEQKNKIKYSEFDKNLKAALKYRIN